MLKLGQCFSYLNRLDKIDQNRILVSDVHIYDITTYLKWEMIAFDHFGKPECFIKYLWKVNLNLLEINKENFFSSNNFFPVYMKTFFLNIHIWNIIITYHNFSSLTHKEIISQNLWSINHQLWSKTKLYENKTKLEWNGQTI